MAAHLGPFVALMALLAMAGLTKIIDPASTSGALRTAGLPHRYFLVRSLGVAECLIGAGGIAIGGRWLAGAAGLMYVAFAVFVGYALRMRLPISSCGCLGASETPPTKLHIIVNGSAALLLAVAVVFPVIPFEAFAAASFSQAALMVVFSGTCTYLLYGLITVLPLSQKQGRVSPVALSSSNVVSSS